MDLLKLSKHKMQPAQKFSLSDWSALIEAWLRMSFFHFALLVTSYDRLDKSTRAVDSLPRRESSADAERLHRLTRYAARLHFIPMTCLVQSLTLQSMLREQNIPAQIKIGAQKTQGVLYAHAWVEVDKKPVGEADDVAKKFKILAAVEMNSRQLA